MVLAICFNLPLQVCLPVTLTLIFKMNGAKRWSCWCIYCAGFINQYESCTALKQFTGSRSSDEDDVEVKQ